MYLYVKRCIDIVCSGLGLVVVFPILVVLALLIGIQMGRPIMFKQMRPGLNGRPFICDMSLIGSRHLLIQYLDYII